MELAIKNAVLCMVVLGLEETSVMDKAVRYDWTNLDATAVHLRYMLVLGLLAEYFNFALWCTK